MTKAEIQAQYSQLAMQMGDLTFRIEDQTRSLELLKNTAIALRKRRDELQVMFADDPADARGFRTVYTGPAHPYGGGLWPIPGLGIGYSETKIVECFDLFNAIATGKQPSPNFEDGLLTELVADALLRSGETGKWERVE